MKFTPKELFRHGRYTFEPENTYTLENYPGCTEEDVRAWHSHGWTEVEGMDPAPERVVRGNVVKPHTASHTTTENRNNG